MDESGDLGFNFSKSRTSKYFIITFLFSLKQRPIDKIISKVFQSMPQNKRVKHCGTLHCSHEHPRTKWKFYNLMKNHKDDFQIMVIRLNKSRVYTKMQNEKDVLYNYATNILLGRIFIQKLVPTDKNITLIASQRETSKYVNNNFKDYLNTQISDNHGHSLNIKIQNPHQNKGLQAVDFLSWAIYQKYENNDESYYQHIKDMIVDDYSLFGN